jgi:periplasmic divalent cation tolerance protein
MEQYIQVITTTANKKDAETIAASLVEERLAACVQIAGPVQSTYRWEGKIEQAEEWQCLIKSRHDLFPELEQAIKRLHPYAVPEIIALTMTAVSHDYEQWLQDELRAPRLLPPH